VLLATANGSFARAARSAPVELAQLKAAYVLNFARYTSWPDGSFDDATSPIVIGVAGDDALGGFLEELVKGETARGHPIDVRRIDVSAVGSSADDAALSALAGRLRRVHVLFIGRGAQERARWLLDRVEHLDVLTVSDVDDFAERGGMIGLVLRDRRLAFDVNLDRIQGSRVTLSSQVLRLARIVVEKSS